MSEIMMPLDNLAVLVILGCVVRVALVLESRQRRRKRIIARLMEVI